MYAELASVGWGRFKSFGLYSDPFFALLFKHLVFLIFVSIILIVQVKTKCLEIRHYKKDDAGKVSLELDLLFFCKYMQLGIQLRILEA